VKKAEVRFDLDAELKADPPKTPIRKHLLDHPRVREWLVKLIALRTGDAGASLEYIAGKLTQGCRVEGLLGPKDSISSTTLRRYLAANPHE